MKQKIVLKVQMNCDKCRTKALEVASKAHGVISLAITGADKNQLEVVGDGVDSPELVTSLKEKVGYTTIQRITMKMQMNCDKCRTKELVTSLRKKVGYTKIMSVTKEAVTEEPRSVWSSSGYVQYPPPPPPPYGTIYYEPRPSSDGCSIM